MMQSRAERCGSGTRLQERLLMRKERKTPFESSGTFIMPQSPFPVKLVWAPGPEAVKKAKTLKEEGNAFVKKGEHKKAVEKYTQSLGHDPTEVTTYTNRALCYLSLKMFNEAISDCDEALLLDSANIKAFYRRAQAYKELKIKKSCIEDLNNVLKIEPNNAAAQKLLQEVQKMK